uniref:Uncharacterized protein n=1 Tax=Plectus sambesii TaxID=2011161 RepID=A0A914XPR3_9BILA
MPIKIATNEKMLDILETWEERVKGLPEGFFLLCCTSNLRGIRADDDHGSFWQVNLHSHKPIRYPPYLQDSFAQLLIDDHTNAVLGRSAVVYELVASADVSRLLTFPPDLLNAGDVHLPLLQYVCQLLASAHHQSDVQ